MSSVTPRPHRASAPGGVFWEFAMQVEMLRPFRGLKAGKVLEVTDGVGELWIRQRKAKRVQLVPQIETERMVPQESHDRMGGRRMRRSV